MSVEEKAREYCLKNDYYHEEEGALAYNEASRKYHGEFGCINEEIEAALKEMGK